MNFGQKLRKLRKETGKSQTQAANEITQQFPPVRMSQTYLSTLEQKESAPREDVLEVFAAYYSVPITHFFDTETDRQGIELAKSYLKKILSNAAPDSAAVECLEDVRRDYDKDDEHLDF